MAKIWIDEPRIYDLEPLEIDGKYEKKLFLTKEYESIEEIPNISFIPLVHQRITVKAMLDLERKQKCKIKASDEIDENTYIETRAGVLSEHPGSGKTFEILMLIALNPIPAKKTEITTLPFPKLYGCGNSQSKRSQRNKIMNSSYGCCVKKTYKKFIKQTIIFVGKSVLSQWKETIENYTKLKVLMISDLASLKKFYSAVFEVKKDPEISKYDIILVKNGNISGAFNVGKLKNTQLENIKSKPIISIFGEIFRDICCARVVLDDVDYLAVPNSAKIIPALFTWFVSATKKKSPGKRICNIETNNVRSLLNSYKPSYVSIWGNAELFTFFNIGCTNKLIDESTSASVVNYYVYKFENPNDKIIGLLGAMNIPDINNIMEMLNGDALITAAETVGSKSASVIDVVHKILDDKYNTYMKYINCSKYIELVKEKISKLPRTKESINAIILDQIKKNIQRPGPISFIENLKGVNSAINVLIKDLEAEINAFKETNGKAIERLKDNLKEGDCPITGIPLSEAESIVITKCCTKVISGEVVSWALKFKAERNGVKGKCPNCRADIDFRNLIFIEKGDIDLEEDIEEKLEEEVTSAPQYGNQKYDCIINIIQGDEKTGEQKKDINIPNLLVGNIDKGEANIEDKKILIFSNFKETMKIVEEKLIDECISYMKVQGTASQIKEAIVRYLLPNDNEESINVLLISGPKFVAGLNLQNTTDLIFTGKIKDGNIESQIAGRVCRYGRKTNANIHYVLYNNEYDYMF